MGVPTKGFQMALGALIIKGKLGVSDRETINQIRENPYLQYFLGLHEYSNKPPFDASMLVHFRKRISFALVSPVNESVVQFGMESAPLETTVSEESASETDDDASTPLDLPSSGNQG